MVTNHRPDRPSQMATAQSEAWEARQAIPECTKPRQAIPTAQSEAWEARQAIPECTKPRQAIPEFSANMH